MVWPRYRSHHGHMGEAETPRGKHSTDTGLSWIRTQDLEIRLQPDTLTTGLSKCPRMLVHPSFMQRAQRFDGPVGRAVHCKTPDCGF